MPGQQASALVGISLSVEKISLTAKLPFRQRDCFFWRKGPFWLLNLGPEGVLCIARAFGTGRFWKSYYSTYTVAHSSFRCCAGLVSLIFTTVSPLLRSRRDILACAACLQNVIHLSKREKYASHARRKKKARLHYLPYAYRKAAHIPSSGPLLLLPNTLVRIYL